MFLRDKMNASEKAARLLLATERTHRHDVAINECGRSGHPIRCGIPHLLRIDNRLTS